MFEEIRNNKFIYDFHTFHFETREFAEFFMVKFLRVYFMSNILIELTCLVLEFVGRVNEQIKKITKESTHSTKELIVTKERAINTKNTFLLSFVFQQRDYKMDNKLLESTE